MKVSDLPSNEVLSMPADTQMPRAGEGKATSASSASASEASGKASSSSASMVSSSAPPSSSSSLTESLGLAKRSRRLRPSGRPCPQARRTMTGRTK